MPSTSFVPAAPAPPGWIPQTVLTARFPAMAELRCAIQPEIRTIEARLDREEAGGADTSRLRRILRELRWRLEYTGDTGAVRRTIDRLRSLAEPASRPSPEEPRNASADVWFLELDDRVDRMLAPDFGGVDRVGPLLDRINEPRRLEEYLYSLLLSRLMDDGIDRRKELNFATADLVRLILWRRPADYCWDPRLEPVVRRFVAEWQDPRTGFFGATYLVDGGLLRTVDLSLTFHMARYLEGEIGYWPELIDTLISIHNARYPNGWLDEIGLTSHNNYDVAILFQLGWPKMRPDQRRLGAQELARLLDWCLTTAIAPDGRIAARAVGESLAESFYFTIAFLDTVGYFDPTRCFWTDRSFPDAPAMRARLEQNLSKLHQHDPLARMASERLARYSREPQLI